MASLAVHNEDDVALVAPSSTNGHAIDVGSSSVLHRSLKTIPHKVVAAKGLYLTLSNGQKILDATGGAAVSCLGHGNARVQAAITRQMAVVSYCHSLFFSTQVAEDLAAELCAGTGGAMTKAFIVSSGEYRVDDVLFGADRFADRLGSYGGGHEAGEAVLPRA